MQRDPNLVRLSRDHHTGLVLAKRAREPATTEATERRAAWTEMQARFADELEPHFQREEQGLLPALRAAGEDALVDRPRMAIYHASKAFVVSFSEAVQTELGDMGSDVTLTCLCPGPTDTRFFERADMEHTWAAKLAMDQEQVADAGYQALMDGERVHIPGIANTVMTFTRRVTPKRLQARITERAYESAETP
jgi:short-subunit dehydrogenase